MIECCYCKKPPSEAHPIAGFIPQHDKNGYQLESICFNVDCRDKQLAEDEEKRRIELKELQKEREMYQQSPEFKQRAKAELKKKREKWRSQDRCGDCGRKLIHPVSIGLGKGPVCGKHGYSDDELEGDE